MGWVAVIGGENDGDFGNRNYSMDTSVCEVVSYHGGGNVLTDVWDEPAWNCARRPRWTGSKGEINLPARCNRGDIGSLQTNITRPAIKR